MSSSTTGNSPINLDADLEPGRQVGEYIIGEKIGVGGFGTVYRAEHPLIGKVVAIKVLGMRLSAEPEMVSRFVAEARSVNQIRSKYVVDIFGFGKLDDGRQYCIMELLDGMPLDEYLEDSGCLSLAEAIPILRGIGKALDAAHGSGVAHRDLKPENVFLVRDEQGGFRPKLLDFGIAKLLGDQDQMHKTRTGAPIGTPLYMSPEQCRGKGVDHRTDIYAFGCMTYRMLTGVVPFDGDGYMDILFKQIQSDATPPSQINPALPPGIDGSIAHMMAKDPASRPTTLADAVADLERWAVAGGITLPPGTASSMFTPLPMHTTGDPRPGARPGSMPSFAGAATMAADTHVSGAPVIPKRKSGLIIALAGVVLAAGVIAFVVVRGYSEKEAASPTPTPSINPAAGRATDAAPREIARPAFVSVEITGVPEGTRVKWGTKGVIGVAPGTIQLERGTEPLTLLLEADGYQPETATVVPVKNHELELELTPLPDAATAKIVKGKGKGKGKGRGKGKGEVPGNTKNSLEDPFQKKK